MLSVVCCNAGVVDVEGIHPDLQSLPSRHSNVSTSSSQPHSPTKRTSAHSANHNTSHTPTHSGPPPSDWHTDTYSHSPPRGYVNENSLPAQHHGNPLAVSGNMMSGRRPESLAVKGHEYEELPISK